MALYIVDTQSAPLFLEKYWISFQLYAVKQEILEATKYFLSAPSENVHRGSIGQRASCPNDPTLSAVFNHNMKKWCEMCSKLADDRAISSQANPGAAAQWINGTN